MKDIVDEKFDKVEKFWDRLQKLLLKIVGGVVGISLACYIAYGQLKEKHEETVNTHMIKESARYIPESAVEHKEEYVIIKETFIIDDYGYREGDTVYVDYYDDGFIDKYYKTDGKRYYEDE